MTQKEFTKAVATDLNKQYASTGKKVSESLVDDVIKTEVKVGTAALKKGEKIQISGLGSFDVVKRAARNGRNPLTGETIKIAAKKVPKFKAVKALKEAIN